MRMVDLASQTGLSPSGLTRSVDRLVAERLVCRERCPGDHRGAYAVLTREGRAKVSAAIVLHQGQIDDLVCGVLTADEEDQMASLLLRLRDRVNPEAALTSERPHQKAQRPTSKLA